MNNRTHHWATKNVWKCEYSSPFGNLSEFAVRRAERCFVARDNEIEPR